MKTRSLAAIFCATLALLIASACSDASKNPSSASSAKNDHPTATACAELPLPIDQLIEQFVTRWNEHQATQLAQLFTNDAELDMSSPSQGTQYGQEEKKWTVSVGQTQIQHFAELEWAMGERLAFSAVDKFAGGGNAVGMKATFSDGKVQNLQDAKFVFNDCQVTLLHVVVVATSPAH